MGHLDEELQRIQDAGEKAWTLICKGRHKEARSKLRKISNSCCVSESTRIQTTLEGIMLVKEGKTKKAKELIQRNVSYLWGNTDALWVLNQSHPPADPSTRHYYIEIKGGRAALGGFTTFGDEHIASFEVLANSEAEALAYISEICTFLEPDGKDIVKSVIGDVDIDENTRQGVVQTHPFRLSEDSAGFPEKTVSGESAGVNSMSENH